MNDFLCPHCHRHVSLALTAPDLPPPPAPPPFLDCMECGAGVLQDGERVHHADCSIAIDLGLKRWQRSE